MSNEIMEGTITNHIHQLPSELKWRILFYLPSNLLLKIGLSNQQAWFIYNSTRSQSKPWDDNIEWLSNLTSFTLFAPDHLYVFTLSDLHRHSTRNHECFSMDISKGNGGFKLVPSPEYGGFVLMNDECVDVPWSDIPYISKSSSNLFLTNGRIPRISPAYKFLERELAHDDHIQRYLNRWRDPSEISDYEIDDHMVECNDCEWSTDYGSDSSYSPSDCDDDCSSSSSSGNDEDTAEVLRFHLDDLKSRISEHEKKELERRLEREKEERRKKAIYCHNFNNKGGCSYGDECHFLHEESPLCWFDAGCTRIKCGFYHSGNPKPQILNPSNLIAQPEKLLDQIEVLESTIKKLEGESKVPAIDLGSSNLQTDVEHNINEGCEEILQKSCKVFEDDLKMMLSGFDGKEMTRKRGYSFRDRYGMGLVNGVNVSPLKLKEADIKETNRFNCINELSVTEHVNNDEDLLWKEFAADFSTRTNKQFFKDHEMEKREYYDLKRKRFLETHEKTYPFPLSWTNKVPGGSNFPILFFLSQHPKKMDTIHLQNKRKIENCFAWEVYELMEKSNNSKKIGIAVMSIESCSKPNLSCWLDYDDMRRYPHRSTCIFGTEKLTCIGDFHSSELPILTKKTPKTTPEYFNVHILKDGLPDSHVGDNFNEDNVSEDEYDGDYDYDVGDDDYDEGDDDYDY